MGGQTAIDSTSMYQDSMYRNPMYQNGYMFSSNALEQDIYGRLLSYSMHNGQMPLSFGSGNGNGNGALQNPQASNGGGIRPIWPAIGVGGATYLAGTQLDFIKPVDANGKVTEQYLSHFSGEYAAMRNGEAIQNFYNNLGKDVKVTPENFKGLMTDIEKLGLEKDPAKITEAAKNNPLLKSVLEKHGIVDESGVLRTGKSLKDVRNVFTDLKISSNDILSKYNYTMQSEMATRFKGLNELWSKCTTREAKIAFLKENAGVLGIDKQFLSSLHFQPEGITDYGLDFIYKNHCVEARGKLLNETLNATRTKMAGIAETWTKGEGKFFSRGAFEGLSKEAGNAAKNGLKLLRKSKVKWVAAAAAIGTWLYCKFC